MYWNKEMGVAITVVYMHGGSTKWYEMPSYNWLACVQ